MVWPRSVIDSPGSATAIPLLLACALAAAAGFVLGLVLTYGLRWAGRRFGLPMAWTRAERSPLVVLLMIIAVRLTLVTASAGSPWIDLLVEVLDLALIAVVGWALLVLVRLVEQGALRKYPARSLEDRRSRHALTKITLLRRVSDALIITIVVTAMLWTVPVVREIGIGLLASAGVLGIVFGLAAQTSLSNLFAGIQIAFTDAIRIDDIVDIEGRWGRIEEITLTYVVVRVWDGTSLILPCTYFTTTPFMNWTHAGTSTTGIVEIAVDWQVPVDDIRAELQRVLGRSSRWDGRTGLLHVEDASGPYLTLVAEVSSPDGNTLTPLCREVREALVTYIQREHAGVLPRERGEIDISVRTEGRTAS
jgi:small-conductance mechanosensitive channel